MLHRESPQLSPLLELAAPWASVRPRSGALGLRTASLEAPWASASSLGAPWPPYVLTGSAMGLRTVSLGAPWSPYGLAGSALGLCGLCGLCGPLRPVQLTVSTSGNIQNGCQVQQKCCSTVGLETLKTACECCRTASIQNCLSMESTGAG